MTQRGRKRSQRHNQHVVDFNFPSDTVSCMFQACELPPMRGKQDKMARTLPAKSLQLPPALSKLWEQTSDAIGLRHLEMLKRNVEEKEENQRLAVEQRREALAAHDRFNIICSSCVELQICVAECVVTSHVSCQGCCSVVAGLDTGSFITTFFCAQ